MAISKEETRYTYRDYASWDDGERWELIDGIAYNMTPAPLLIHQMIVGNLSRLIGDALKDKRCTVFIAPTDVVLSEENVIQPDVFVVCDPDKVTKENIQGAPDFIAEVLSPSTSKKDRDIKRGLYERFGVKEYALLEPEFRYLEWYRLNDGRYGKSEAADRNEAYTIESLGGLRIELKDVFDYGPLEPKPPQGVKGPPPKPTR